MDIVVSNAFDQWSVIKTDSFECDSQFEPAHEVHQKTIFFCSRNRKKMCPSYFFIAGVANNALINRGKKYLYLN